VVIPCIHPHDQGGNTPLIYAADSGHESTVDVLLEAGADVEAKNNVSVLIVSPSPTHITSCSCVQQYDETAADRTCRAYSKSDKDAVRARILALLADPTLVLWNRLRLMVLWRVVRRRDMIECIGWWQDDHPEVIPAVRHREAIQKQLQEKNKRRRK